MHWGLTTFERKRIERIALDHPFFDMHPQLLTRKELRAVLAQGPRKSGPQVITEVRKELGIIYAPDCQNKRTFAEALRDASFVPSFRRTILFAVLSLLLILFMTLTVPGRAFAEEVFSIVVNYVRGTLKAQKLSSSEVSQYWSFTSLPDDIVSPQSLAEEIQFPIITTTDELLSFRYTPLEDDYLSIKSTFRDKNAKTYVIMQDIMSSDLMWGYGGDAQEGGIVIDSGLGIQLYGSVASDGTISFVGYTDLYIIELTSREHTIDELCNLANTLTFTE